MTAHRSPQEHWATRLRAVLPRTRRAAVVAVLALVLVVGGGAAALAQWGLRSDDGAGDDTAGPVETDDPFTSVPDDPEQTPTVPEETKEPRPERDSLARKAERLSVPNEVPLDPATFRVGTFNLLGDSHTTARGNKPGLASGVARMSRAVGLIRSQAVSIVTLQEFEAPQKAAFNRLTGGAWEVYTGSARGRESVAWRTADWSLVDSGTIPVPYFRGNRLPMPWVVLEHRETGREVAVISIHNPTSNPKRGNNERWRDVATQLEMNLVSDLASTKGRSVLLTGDFNEREEAFCRVTAGGFMNSANGGSGGPPCSLPPQLGIDFVFGTPDLDFTDYRRVANVASDHPFITTTVTADAPIMVVPDDE